MTPTTVDDEDVYEALVEAIEEEDTLPGGGAPVSAIVDRLPIQATATRTRLERLVDKGDVEKGWGLPPGKWPQVTYEPSASQD